jgi:exopolysaccharide production protein ExoQ
MVARYPMEVTIDRLGVACVMMAVISAVISVALPSIGSITVTHPGSWNGVFPHKNSLGALTIIANIVYGWKFWKLRTHRVRHGLIIVFLFLVCVMSQSKTSLLASLLAVMAYPTITLLRVPGLLRLWLFFIFGAGAILGASILGLFWTEILTGLGRDPTLTGRVPLWSLLLTFAAKHPLLGYGYSAFWLQWNPDADYVWKVVQWAAPEGHNAYIDMLLQLGIVGFALSSYTLLWVVQRSLRDSIGDRASWSCFILVFSFSFLLTNMSETLLYRGGDIYCWLMALTYFSLRQLHQEAAAPAVSRKVAWGPVQRRV